MILKTKLCDVLNIDVPVIQAPIGSASTPELAAAVSNAGGLGTLALSWTPVESVASVVRNTRNLTSKPFAVNLCLAWPQEERLERCLSEDVAIVSTFWGDPGPYAEAIAAAGAVHIHTVASADEARAAVEEGVDVVVAQGWEAGGHVWGEVTTMALVPRVVDAVLGVPVVAAGGIGDGRGLVAALALGASGVWLGTLFLLADEANVHKEYRAKIATARETDTIYSELFDIGWADAPHRTLKNTTVIEWERAGRPNPPDRPGEGEVVARSGRGDVTRYSDVPPLLDHVGNVEALAMYAGQSVGLVNARRPAATIIKDLIDEAMRVVGHLGRLDL